MITRRLPDEPSPELLQQKISFLARYLFMDEQALQEQATREGVESIIPLIFERIRQLLPEEIRNAPPQTINTKEEYEKRLQEMVNKQEARIR